MSRYDDILARLRAATGPDLELSEGVFDGIYPAALLLHGGSMYKINEVTSMSAGALIDSYGDPVSSIDAALALVKKKLPGWTYQLFTDPLLAPFGARCRLGSVERTRRGRGWPKHNFEAHAATAPLAILIALFEALKAKEE